MSDTNGSIPDEIAPFLKDGGYDSIDEWMLDSEYVQNADGDWFYPTNYADPTVAGKQVEPIGTILGAMEACGFGVFDAPEGWDGSEPLT